MLCMGLALAWASHADARGVRVSGYVKKDGTYVAPHYRSAPNRLRWTTTQSGGTTTPIRARLARRIHTLYLQRVEHMALDTCPVPRRRPMPNRSIVALRFQQNRLHIAWQALAATGPGSARRPPQARRVWTMRNASVAAALTIWCPRPEVSAVSSCWPLMRWPGRQRLWPSVLRGWTPGRPAQSRLMTLCSRPFDTKSAQLEHSPPARVRRN